MHTSNPHLKLTVYLGDEVIGYLRPISRDEEPSAAAQGMWLAIPIRGLLAPGANRSVSPKRLTDNLIHLHRVMENERIIEANKRKQLAAQEVKALIDDFHNNLFNHGLNDMAIESMIESFLDVKGLTKSIYQLSVNDALDHDRVYDIG